MHCSEELSSIDKSEDFIKSRDTTQMTSEPQSSASEASQFTASDEADAIYYFGYGPIVNPIVRKRRGCMIPPQNIQTAILYDHRLKFVAGGTANIVASRGWDVKGVLLRFENKQEWEAFRQFDANYDVKDISVSLIDKTNLDPKKKNDHTAPFEDDLDISQRSTSLLTSHRMHQSCYASGNMSLNNLPEGSSSDEEDYSCPFSFGKPAKVDPDAITCKTFVIRDSSPGARHVINENTTFRGNGSGDSVVGKPQERYLKLITDGLRAHDVDETYIRDEILAVNYIPNERDKVVDQNYRYFPNAKKVPKTTLNKYETKLCNSKDNSTHFLIGTRIVRVDDSPDLQNPCIQWLRAQGHGQGDITLLVHQTFIDKDIPFHIPNPTLDAITGEHQRWAEHVVFLYLERAGLTATVIGELLPNETKIKKGWGGRSMPSLANFKMGKNKAGSAQNKSWSKVNHRASLPMGPTKLLRSKTLSGLVTADTLLKLADEKL